MRRTWVDEVSVIDADRIEWTPPAGHRPRSDDRMLSRRRRRRVVAAAVAGAAIAALAAAATALWNPWRFAHLMTSTHDWHPLTVLAGSAVMLVFAGWLGLRSPAAVRATVCCGVVALLAFACVGGLEGLANTVAPVDPAMGPRVVAISPDGRYEIVVIYRGHLVASETAVVRVRSREGLLSRESTDLGCVRPANSEAAVVRVAFTGSHELTIDANDGRSWQAAFDPRTLRPTATFALPCR